MTMTFVMRVIRIMVEIVTAIVIVMLKLVLIRKRRMTLIMIMTLAKMVVKTMIMRMTPKLIHQQKNTTVW